MDWQPQPGPLAQLAQVLRDSLSGYDPAAQKKAEQVGQNEASLYMKRPNSCLDAQTSQRLTRHQQLPGVFGRDEIQPNKHEPRFVAWCAKRGSH